MKARVIYRGMFWYGQIYTTYTSILNPGSELEGWIDVTSACYTKIGAKIALSLWKRKNLSEEFEL